MRSFWLMPSPQGHPLLGEDLFTSWAVGGVDTLSGEPGSWLSQEAAGASVLVEVSPNATGTHGLGASLAWT